MSHISRFSAFLLMVLSVMNGRAQKNNKTSTYISLQYNQTIFDLTRPNNPWSIGSGLQYFLDIPESFQLTAELTGDLYLEDDKVLRLGLNGKAYEDIGGMVNLFCGASLNPHKRIHLAIAAGPSLINGKISFGLKPSAGSWFSKNKNWLAKFSFINIYNRHEGHDFGSWSFSIGKKLF